MRRWLRLYLCSATLQVHFWRALIVGLVLRLLSAYFVYGPQALDDYKHGVYPAWQFFAHLPLDLPDYRSRLLVWFLGAFVHIASWFGVESALGQVRAMYVGLAVTSLVAIVGTYLYAQLQRSKLYGATLLYMMAMFPLMPFVSTRAFGEAVALAFVVFGFGALEKARQQTPNRFGWWFLGFLSLGVATLFRFHAGILFFAALGILFYLRLWIGVFAGVAAGFATLVSQAVIDVASDKAPFGTLIEYLAANEGGAAKYGVSPWYNTWLFVLVVALAPFSFVLFGRLKSLWRRQWAILIPWLLFVSVHSLVPHKEERFLYPIVGLELWALSYLWASSALSVWSRRVFSSALFGIGSLLLLVVCFVNSQEGEIEPPAYVQSHYANVSYLDFQSLFGLSRFQFYFLRPPSVLKQVQPSDFTALRIDDEFASEPGRSAVVLLTSDPAAHDQLRLLEGVSTVSSHCLEMREAGSMIDRLLYKMNPKHNQRRRPTWYLVCERSKSAL